MFKKTKNKSYLYWPIDKSTDRRVTQGLAFISRGLLNKTYEIFVFPQLSQQVVRSDESISIGLIGLTQHMDLLNKRSNSQHLKGIVLAHDLLV